jgi:hypothetical protein
VNLTAAYRELCALARELEAERGLSKAQRAALKLLERKATKLQGSLDRRRNARPCRVCGIRKTGGIVCNRCWWDLPADAREAWRKAKTNQEKRAAARTIFTICGHHTAAAEYAEPTQP